VKVLPPLDLRSDYGGDEDNPLPEEDEPEEDEPEDQPEDHLRMAA
jgi:hypothetical protein